MVSMMYTKNTTRFNHLSLKGNDMCDCDMCDTYPISGFKWALHVDRV